MELVFVISLVIIFFLFPVYYTKIWNEYNTIAFLPAIFKLAGIFILIICSIVPSITGFNDIPVLNKIRELVIVFGLIIICLSREKDEKETYNGMRLVSLFISLIVSTIIVLGLIVCNLFDIQEISVANFSDCVLASYLLVFHWYKKRDRTESVL